MLKNFLKENIESKKPETRLAAVRNLDISSSGNQEKLADVAATDTDDSVRLAALERLTDINALVRLFKLESSKGDSSAQFNVMIRNRLESRIAEPDQDLAMLTDLTASGDVDLSVLFACHASDESVRNAVIDKLQGETVFSEIVTQSRYHSTRLAAAARLSDESIIVGCVGKIRTKDKIVARILQEQLDRSLAERRKKEARVQEIADTTSAMKNLSTTVWSPGFSGRFTALSQRWEQISPTPSEEELQTFNKFKAECATIVEGHKSQQQVVGYCAEALEQLNAIIAELKSDSLELIVDKIGSLKKRAVDANAVWRISVDAAQPSVELQKEFEQKHQLTRQLTQDVDALLEVNTTDAEQQQTVLSESVKAIESILAKYSFVETKKEKSDGASTIKRTFEYVFLNDAEQLRSVLDAQLRQKKNIDNDRIKALHKQMGSFGAAISDGKWSIANSLSIRVEKKIAQLSDHPSHKSLLDKFGKHKVKLDELADWQDFAAKPKLEALCEQMEKLPEEKLKPEEQGKQIKSLQNEWKALGPSRASVELWSRFKEAGDKAYKPVGEFQQLKRAERDEKQKNKKKICSRLDQYLTEVDWDAADWKEVERTLRQAKNDWKKNRVIDRKPNKSLEDRFTALVEKFNEKLNAEYDANEKFKEELIEKISKIAESDVSQHAINQTRRLQNTWKQPGIMRRKQDQELWEKFNGFCRDIYKRHGNVKREKAESGLEHVRKAREIVRDIKSLCQKKDPDEKQFQKLQDEFNGLAEFPEKEKRGLIKDFNRVSQQFSALRDSSSKNQARAEMDELVRLSGLCAQYEALVDRTEFDASKVDALDSEWDSSEIVMQRKWLTAIEKRRKAALAHLKAGTSYDFDENEKKRRLLCIQMEIMTGKETPSEDKAMRMEYQLAHLQQGMGSSAASDPSSSRQEMLIKWLCLAPAAEATRDKLESRFQQCLD